MCAAGGSNQALAAMGRFGDTELAHVNPKEKTMLKAMGGSGTTNPKTGLKEYHWYHSHSSPISIPTPKIPTSTGDIGIISDIADATGYTGSDLDTAGQELEGAITGVIDDTSEAVGEAVSGSFESGEFNPSFYMDDMMGFGGGFFNDFDYTLDDFVDDVSDSTPDIKIIPEDLNTILPDTGDIETITEIAEGATDVLNQANEGIIQPIGENVLGIVEGAGDVVQVTGETVGGITTDILQGDVGTVVQDLNETTGSFLTNPLGTTQEVLDHNSGQVMEAINQTVDFVTNPVGTVEDAIDRGEDFFESVGEETQENVEAYTDVITDIGETAEEIGEVAQETMDTSMNVIGDTSANLVQALAAAGLLGSNQQDMMGGEGNAEAIMAGDPRMLSLMARRNQARKRGKAQLRKGGGLYIPVGTGLQVPA